MSGIANTGGKQPWPDSPAAADRCAPGSAGATDLAIQRNASKSFRVGTDKSERKKGEKIAATHGAGRSDDLVESVRDKVLGLGGSEFLEINDDDCKKFLKNGLAIFRTYPGAEQDVECRLTMMLPGNVLADQNVKKVDGKYCIDWIKDSENEQEPKKFDDLQSLLDDVKLIRAQVKAQSDASELMQDGFVMEWNEGKVREIFDGIPPKGFFLLPSRSPLNLCVVAMKTKYGNEFREIQLSDKGKLRMYNVEETFDSFDKLLICINEKIQNAGVIFTTLRDEEESFDDLTHLNLAAVLHNPAAVAEEFVLSVEAGNEYEFCETEGSKKIIFRLREGIEDFVLDLTKIWDDPKIRIFQLTLMKSMLESMSGYEGMSGDEARIFLQSNCQDPSYILRSVAYAENPETHEVVFCEFSIGGKDGEVRTAAVGLTPEGKFRIVEADQGVWEDIGEGVELMRSSFNSLPDLLEGMDRYFRPIHTGVDGGAVKKTAAGIRAMFRDDRARTSEIARMIHRVYFGPNGPEARRSERRRLVRELRERRIEVISTSEGRWLQGRELGHGTFKTVYEAFHPFTGVRRAFAEINPQPNARGNEEVEKELQWSALLNHPSFIKYHSVTVYSEWGEQRKGLLSAYADGGDLLNKLKQMSWKEAAHYTKSMLEGILYLQRGGIIHRDLKPANFLIIGGNLTFMDYGLMLRGFSRVPKGIGNGTHKYTPPEAFGVRKIDGGWVQHHNLRLMTAALGEEIPNFDNFSAGRILLEMVFLGCIELNDYPSTNPLDVAKPGEKLLRLNPGNPLAMVIAGLSNPDPADRMSIEEAIELLGDVDQIEDAFAGIRLSE